MAGGDPCGARGAWIARLVGPIPAGALCRPVLLAGDGVRRSGPAIQAVFRAPIPTARRGRPRLRPWEDGCLGHVITPDAGRPVVGVTRRIVPGRDQLVAPLIRQSQDPGGLNTASMERLTATCRAHLARRTRALARHTQTVEAGLVLVATVANCCADHQSRRLPGISAGHTWLPRSPAMAAGITPQRGSVTDWLDDRVPPPPGVPPTPRGRPSSETQRLIDRWCS
ncbi:MAG: hypothetical protein M5U01_00490 [Ardenticatenaceae bacterium]|nr:hypothetical protein [Ardenticatenaceae bacterium]